jgi:Gas vesicle synthesis protein GvpL/GvpF
MSPRVLIHAVMRAHRHPPLDARSPIEGAALSFIAESGLGAVVSILPDDGDEDIFGAPEAAAEISLRHHALLTSLADRVDLAPVRLGAVYANEESAAALLRDQAADFRAALDRIAGAQEFAVTLTPLPGGPDAPEPAVVDSGRSFLQRRAEIAARQRNHAEAARAAAAGVIDRLKPFASAHSFASPRRHAAADREKRLIDAALLVQRDRAGDFGAAVCSAQEEAAAAGYRLSVRGPLPAYSFVGEAA